MTSEELQKQLVDVRKAYRLLYDYQHHVMDLARFIGNRLGYNSVQGYPVFSGAAPREGKKDIFDLWSWDWLNMYHYEFNFGSKTIEDTNVSFAIHIVSDTGYYDESVENKLDPSSFIDSQDSSTKLIFYASTGEYRWKELQPGDKDFQADFKSEFKKLESGGHILGKSYDLVEFISPESSMTQIKDFIKACKRQNIPI